MKQFIKMIQFLMHADYRFVVLAERGFYKKMDDETYINRMYKAKFGVYPDLIHPKTYTEKLQWLKLHDHRPEYTKMVGRL